MSNIYNLLPLQRRIDHLNQKLGAYADDERKLNIEKTALEHRLAAIHHCRKDLIARRTELTAALDVLKEFEVEINT